jgi:hypothetical protein
MKGDIIRIEPPRRWIFMLFLYLSIGLCLPGQSPTAEHKHGEYDVKSAFIYNFAKFIEWPGGSAPATGGALNLCLLGEDPFGSSLNHYQGRPVKEKKFQVRQVKSPREARNCQILFISASERGRLASILDTIGNVPVLTVGDTEGYARQGVMINLHLESEKVRFSVNLGTAKQAGLKISFHLLRLASQVYE